MTAATTRVKTAKVKIAVIAGRFNEFITQSLLKACTDELVRQGLTQKQVCVHWVPGSFEMPLVALKLAQKKDISAVICLGSVIRGDTYHFEVVANEISRGIMDVALKTGKPVIMGVLTTDTIDQAQKRAQLKGPNKGRDAALAALDMIELLKKV